MKNLIIIVLLFLSNVCVAEDNTKHLDFVLLENGGRCNIDSLFYYDTSQKIYKKSITYKGKIGGIDFSMTEYLDIVKSDTVIMYVNVHFNSYIKRSVPIKIKTDLIEDSLMMLKTYIVPVGKKKRKKEIYKIDFSYFKYHYSYGQIFLID